VWTSGGIVLTGKTEVLGMKPVPQPGRKPQIKKKKKKKKDRSPQLRTSSENFQHHEDFRVLMGYYKITEEI